MKHLSGFQNFLNESTKEHIILDSPCICPNSKFDYRWVVEVNKDNPLKSVMKVQIFHTTKNSNTDKDEWSGILIDAGQHWGVEGLSDALEEVKTKLNIED